MKKIKIKCLGKLTDEMSFQWKSFFDILHKNYDVEFSDNPDYVIFYMPDDANYDYLRYDCIRIGMVGEMETPDFNVADYAIGFDRYLDFGDRFYRFSSCDIEPYRSEYESLLERKTYTMDDVKAKQGFCDFIYANHLAIPQRKELFEKLNEYKRVDSAGRYLNNIGYAVADKLAFQRNHKFSIAVENSIYSGYVTEKLIEPFVAGSVPIYIGDPGVEEEFNEEAFINGNKFASIDELVEYVKLIDNDDDRYLKMLNSNPLMHYRDLADLERFITNIFDQDLTDARRRPQNAYHVDIKVKRKLKHAFIDTKIYPKMEKLHRMITGLQAGKMISKKTK